MAKEKIKAVLLDLGETLLPYGKLDINKIFSEASHRTYDYLVKHNQPVGNYRRYMLRNFFSIRLRCLWSAIVEKDFDSLAVMRRIGDGHKFTLTDEQWECVSWLWYESIAKLAKVESDICQTLGTIKEMGLKLGILSNTFVHSSTLIKHLKKLDVWDFFDSAIFSYDFKFRKPHKQIFLAAADSVKVQPENILFVGDRIRADVKGSTNAGMIPVLISAYTNAGKRVPAGVSCIDRISEIPELIRKHNDI